MQKTALIIGASGLVGSELLKQLNDSTLYSNITSLVRKPSGNNYSLVTEKITDFDNPKQLNDFIKADHIYICIGSTIKKAKTKEAFKIIDVDYPISIAQIAAKNGAEAISVISAMGADSKSGIFYNQMKGLMEEGVINSGIKSINIFRPSLLLGKRKESRFGEKVGIFFMKPLSFLFCGPLKKYRAVKSEKLAAAMIASLQNPSDGVRIYRNDEFV